MVISKLIEIKAATLIISSKWYFNIKCPSTDIGRAIDDYNMINLSPRFLHYREIGKKQFPLVYEALLANPLVSQITANTIVLSLRCDRWFRLTEVTNSGSVSMSWRRHDKIEW